MEWIIVSTTLLYKLDHREDNGDNDNIRISLETLKNFKYLGLIISNKDAKSETISRISKATALALLDIKRKESY